LHFNDELFLLRRELLREISAMDQFNAAQERAQRFRVDVENLYTAERTQRESIERLYDGSVELFCNEETRHPASARHNERVRKERDRVHLAVEELRRHSALLAEMDGRMFAEEQKNVVAKHRKDEAIRKVWEVAERKKMSSVRQAILMVDSEASKQPYMLSNYDVQIV
jgi:hypothetical protein